MPIDASIPLGIRPPQFDSPLETYGKVEQLKGLRAQGQLRDLQMQEFQDKRSREQQRRGIFSQGLRGEELAGALEQGGYIDDATGIRKQMTEGEKARLDMAGKKIELRNQLLQAVIADPREQVFFGAAKEYERVSGDKLPDDFYASIYELRNDPEKIRRAAAGYVLKPEQLLPKADTRDIGGQIIDRTIDPLTGMPTETGRTAKTLTPDSILTDERTRAEGAAGRAVTIRGQNMTDTRARELATATREQGGKPPAGYRWSADGQTLEAVKGGPADKPQQVTEGERKAATLLQRMDNSLSQLEAVTTVTPDAKKPGYAAELLRTVAGDTPANLVTPEARQQVEAAQLDILDAALTLGTGAAYTREQLQGYRKSYFPQIGDDPATVKDKTARLQNVLQAARIAAGRAAPEQPAGRPKLGDRVDGFIYRGGDPANKASWEKER